MPTLIGNKFEANEEEIISLWSRHTDNVSKKILSVNPCLIQKKVIVCPQQELGLELKINCLQRIWNVNVKSCRLKKERQKPIRHGA